MASACVNNIRVSSESFLDCSPTYTSYGWLSPRISFSRDFPDEASNAKTSSTTEQKLEKQDLEVSGKDVRDFEFRLEDPVIMLPVDELFSDRKLVPLQLTTNLKEMAGKAGKAVVKAVGEYQYPWHEKLAKYKDELSKGVWGYWELGAWKPLGISGRRRAQLRKEVLLAGEDWPYDPERKEMRSKRKGHKCDRISAEKRANTVELMKKMPDMLLDYKKRRWEKKMKKEEEEDAKN